MDKWVPFLAFAESQKNQSISVLGYAPRSTGVFFIYAFFFK